MREKPKTPLGQAENTKTELSGCYRGAAIGCIGMLLFSGLVGLFIYLRYDQFMKYGLSVGVERLQKRLEQERTLTPEQYGEFNAYLHSLLVYVQKNKINQETMLRYRVIRRSFERVLADGRITREEVGDIRSAMFEAAIPIVRPGVGSRPDSRQDKKNP